MNLIDLRSAALRLEKANRGPKAKLRLPHLLTLLRDGRLKSGFDAPRPVDAWIEIPADYWKKVEMKRFRSLKAASDASFRVPIRDFADQCVEVLGSRLGNAPLTPTDSLKDVALLLSISHHQFDVSVTEDHLDDHLRSARLQGLSNEDDQPAPVGAPQKNWKEIAPLLAAYLLKKHGLDTNERKIEHEGFLPMVNLTRERARMVNVQIAGRGITARQVLNAMHECLVRRLLYEVSRNLPTMTRRCPLRKGRQYPGPTDAIWVQFGSMIMSHR